MKSYVNEKVIADLVKDVSDQHYVMSGTITAITAAQATALGEACMQISLENQLDTLNWSDVTARIEHMGNVKKSLLEWSEQDMKAMATYNQSLVNNVMPIGRQTLAESAAEIARLSLVAVEMLQDFQHMAYNDMREKLMVAVHLLLGSAQAAIHLLGSYLDEWNNPNFVLEYKPVLDLLKQKAERCQSREPLYA